MTTLPIPIPNDPTAERFCQAQLGDYHGVTYDRTTCEVSLTGAGLNETLDADEAYALWVFLTSIHQELRSQAQQQQERR